MARTVFCEYEQRETEGLDFAPWPGELGQRVFAGIGKPEPLKHALSGFWSRRIDERHRLVYAVSGDTLLIAQCRDHY